MAESTARKQWTKEHTTGLYLKLNNNTDQDILQKLNEVSSKQGYIKELIRRDLEVLGEKR